MQSQCDDEARRMRNNYRQTLDGRRSVKTSFYRNSKLNPAPSEATRFNDLEDIDKSLLFRQLRQLIVCMSVFGIYFKHHRSSDCSSGRRFPDPLRSCSPQHLYCLLVNLIIFSHFIWSLVAFRVRVFVLVSCITDIILLMHNCNKCSRDHIKNKPWRFTRPI